ncbi:hypothetical protein PAXRUDRAFT_129885 [Paxillus rubicundulus Ve08.2h10]|uniref:Unplaced genomic scaffold scaffold_12, whole genome shotgun sequence n=1 Tax=Paxillus rubicundulus Ve08.2h10 TaxID=930991 RepID=A0A0D0EAK4_9AGAM|nr:hypothetical protein PAXRUDRAFT_129885 [Paxillus rubicundulus Ve08.2h10]
MAVSQKPIVLWNTTKHTAHVIDDAGVLIKKSRLPPPVRAPQYHVHQPTFTGVVPPLAYFCIKSLSPFPEQLHALAHFRFSYRDDLARALLPLRSQPDEDIQQSTQCSSAPNFDTTALDPRLWATFAQVIHPLPEQLHDLDLPLANIHLPLLQQIPNTPNFSLVTLLSLPNCNHVCDDTISELRRLNSLVALDLRGTNITPYALTVLARGLSWTGDDDSTSRRRTGLWGLRILRLHSCTRIDNKAISVLRKFPLLSIVGSAVKRHLSNLGFSSSGHKHLFHPAPLSLALYTFDNLATTAQNPISPYSCPLHSVFRIHVDELYHSIPHHRTGTQLNTRNVSFGAQPTTIFIPPVPKPPVAKNAKVFAPPKCASTTPSERRPSTARVALEHQSFIHTPWSSNNVVFTVHSSEDGRLDPLAIARLPPPWSTLDAYTPLPIPDGFRNAALSDPAKLNRARLNKQGSGAFSNMVDKLATKRLKVVSEFALAKVQVQVPVKARNPFAKSVKSAFAESNLTMSGAVKRPLSKHESLTEAGPDVLPHSRNSFPSRKKGRLDGTGAETSSKSLKPITTLKPPMLPKEFLPLAPKKPNPASKPEDSLKQARLSFTRPEQFEKPGLVSQKRETETGESQQKVKRGRVGACGTVRK